MHDIYDSEKACMKSFSFSLLVLYHTLKTGDRVIQGPDWQWGSQGFGVLWDDGCDNVYRYGAENAFDVIEYGFSLFS